MVLMETLMIYKLWRIAKSPKIKIPLSERIRGILGFEVESGFEYYYKRF
jgi:hypothetical protein